MYRPFEQLRNKLNLTETWSRTKQVAEGDTIRFVEAPGTIGRAGLVRQVQAKVLGRNGTGAGETLLLEVVDSDGYDRLATGQQVRRRLEEVLRGKAERLNEKSSGVTH